jgi:hypothetical protein
MKKVYILTWCKNIAQLYGSLLVFDTIRVGFPTAEIVVIDNNSIPVAVNEIEKAAAKVKAQFFKLEYEIQHHDHIRCILTPENDESEIYIVDPDVIFWTNVELFSTDKLLAGRLIPAFFDKYSNTLTKARVHTSFIYIPSVKLIREKINLIETNHWGANLIRPIVLKINSEWLHWDTFGQLYECLQGDFEIFTDEMNDSFDHIYAGSHLDILAKRHNLPMMHKVHNLAINDPAALKGIWRDQHQFFLTNEAKDKT